MPTWVLITLERPTTSFSYCRDFVDDVLNEENWFFLEWSEVVCRVSVILKSSPRGPGVGKQKSSPGAAQETASGLKAPVTEQRQ